MVWGADHGEEKRRTQRMAATTKTRVLTFLSACPQSPHLLSLRRLEALSMHPMHVYYITRTYICTLLPFRMEILPLSRASSFAFKTLTHTGSHRPTQAAPVLFLSRLFVTRCLQFSSPMCILSQTFFFLAFHTSAQMLKKINEESNKHLISVHVHASVCFRVLTLRFRALLPILLPSFQVCCFSQRASSWMVSRHFCPPTTAAPIHANSSSHRAMKFCSEQFVRPFSCFFFFSQSLWSPQRAHNKHFSASVFFPHPDFGLFPWPCFHFWDALPSFSARESVCSLKMKKLSIS